MVSASDELKAPADGEYCNILHLANEAQRHRSHMVRCKHWPISHEALTRDWSNHSDPAAISAMRRQLPDLLAFFTPVSRDYINLSALFSKFKI
jgi:hypothetical protein